jgi:hypothetical protein
MSLQFLDKRNNQRVLMQNTKQCAGFFIYDEELDLKDPSQFLDFS